MSRVDPDRIALVLADAMAIGDKAAARKWSLTTRTVERYRVRAKTDPKLSALVSEKKRAVEHDLATMRVAFLRRALTKMRSKLKDASLHDIAGAVKIVGELHQFAMAVEDERPDSPDSEVSEARSGEDGGAAFGAH